VKCRVCDAVDLKLVIDFGDQPWANNFLTADQVGKEPFYPLRLLWCAGCFTVQLDYTVKKEVMFSDHTYLSGMTRTLSEHFRDIARLVDETLMAGRSVKTVLDIGSNDGTQLRHFQDLGYDVLGVESSRTIAAMANQAGVRTINAFFNEELVVRERLENAFDVINAAGVFFHLEELHSVAEGIRRALRRDGVFVVQFLYMKSIVENLAFDQIYHEHLLYYTLTCLNTLLGRHGLALFDAYHSPIHGGSMIAFAAHQGERPRTPRLAALEAAERAADANSFDWYARFAKDIAKVKERSLAFIQAKKREGKTIYGFGAPVKGNTLLNYFRIGTESLDCLVEKNPLRKGLYSPGMHIPVVLEDELDGPPDAYFVLAWNFKHEILERNRNLVEQGVDFFFPVNPQERAERSAP
jgi:SAM-dependent methyltransferase